MVSVQTPSPERKAVENLREQDEATMRASPSSDKMATTFDEGNAPHPTISKLPSTMQIGMQGLRQKKPNNVYQTQVAKVSKRAAETQTEYIHMAQYIVTMLVTLSNMLGACSISYEDIQGYISLKNDFK